MYLSLHRSPPSAAVISLLESEPWKGGRVLSAGLIASGWLLAVGILLLALPLNSCWTVGQQLPSRGLSFSIANEKKGLHLVSESSLRTFFNLGRLGGSAC